MCKLYDILLLPDILLLLYLTGSLLIVSAPQKVKRLATEELHLAETARVFIIHQMRELSLDIYDIMILKKSL